MLLRIFFWWPASVTPTLRMSLEIKYKVLQQKCAPLEAAGSPAVLHLTVQPEGMNISALLLTTDGHTRLTSDLFNSTHPNSLTSCWREFVRKVTYSMVI